MPTRLPPESPVAATLRLDHRALWSLDTLSARDVDALLQAARRLERAARGGSPCRSLQGRNIARLGSANGFDDGAFDRAATELGAQVTRIGPGDPTLAGSADLHRTGRMLGRLYDAIDCAGMPAAQFDGLQRETDVPVFNGLATTTHPLRALAVLVELQALAGRDLRGLRVAFCADPASPVCLALHRLAALAGIAEPPDPADAEFVVEADGRVHAASAPAADGRAAAEDAQRYTLQALLISTIV